MIPKIIHSCWFGNKPKPKKIVSCMESWHEHLPDYTFMEWNESNFDFRSNMYAKKAYENGKFAFVSDITRLWALKTYGGIYLDTDVMVYKSFDPFLNGSCILGFETGNYVATSFLACEREHPLIASFLDSYEEREFQDLQTNVTFLTSYLINEWGLIPNGEQQEPADGIEVYPKDYFSPYDYINCISEKSEHTVCEHLFFVSWASGKEMRAKYIKTALAKVLGKKGMTHLRKFFGRN